MHPSYTQSGRKLGFAVLFFVLCTIGVVTLEPFQFRVPHRVHLMWWDGWFDVVANIGLFVVPGFLFALTRQASTRRANPMESQRRTLSDALVYGALISTCIEVCQAFEPARFPSPTDVMSNTTGACLGAWLFLRISRFLRSDTPLIGMFALELPLMGLIYLLIPLSTLAALTLPRATMASARLTFSAPEWGLLALGCFGGVLLGHVQRFHFGPRRLVKPWQSSAAAAAAFALGTLPALRTNPMVVLAGACVVASAAGIIGALGVRASSQGDRRFEAAALWRGAPAFLCYLAIASLADPQGEGRMRARVEIIGKVESLAAFTVLGYLLAEGWGRLELRYRWVVAYVVVVCGVIALALLRARHGAPYSLMEFEALAFHAVAGAYGGWIYHLQRAHIRSLVAAQRGVGDMPTRTPQYATAA